MNIPFLYETGYMHRLIISALMAFAAAPQVHAAVTMHISASSQHIRQMDVTLADSYLAVQTGEGRMVYDFQSRRRYAINTVANQYVDYSLFDAVGFRVAEMANRLQLGGALAAAKVDTPLMARADHENQLSILGGAPQVVDEKVEGDSHVFYVEGARLAAWSVSGVKVAASDAAQFARFMRYAQGGHPQLLDRLAKGGMIPDHLTLFISGGRDITLSMTQVRSTQAAPAYDLKPYQREISKDGVDAVFDRIASLTPQQLADVRSAHPCDTSSDFSDQAILDTMLGRLECSLSSDTPLALTDQQKQAVAASPSLGLLFAAIRPAKDNEVEDAVKTLAALRQQAPRKGYVLKIFEANNRTRLRQVKESTALLVEVLQTNPLLAGAYKDLGDLLLMQYDSARAWRSWDAGRRVSPALPNFAAVNQFEATLLAQHPEFF
jgi:hypothetical protein